jgi:hypothetical protein
MPVTLPTLGVVFKTEFLKWESHKINPKKWHVFRARILTVNFPVFTSNPPQLHHQKTTSNHPFSPKPPAKTGFHHRQKIPASALSSGRFFASPGMTTSATTLS